MAAIGADNDACFRPGTGVSKGQAFGWEFFMTFTLGESLRSAAPSTQQLAAPPLKHDMFLVDIPRTSRQALHVLVPHNTGLPINLTGLTSLSSFCDV